MDARTKQIPLKPGAKPGPTAIKKMSTSFVLILQNWAIGKLYIFIYWMQLFVGYENKTRTQKFDERKDICRERTNIFCSIRVCHWPESCGICLSWYSGVCSAIRSNYSDISLKYCWQKCWGLIILIGHHWYIKLIYIFKHTQMLSTSYVIRLF